MIWKKVLEGAEGEKVKSESKWERKRKMGHKVERWAHPKNTFGNDDRLTQLSKPPRSIKTNLESGLSVICLYVSFHLDLTQLSSS